MTEDEQEEILQIVRLLQKSPAMNGEFIKLTESVEHIKSTQNRVCTDVNIVIVKQQEAREKLDDMHEALYHPDTGIYKRINDSSAVDHNQQEHIGRIEKAQDDFNNAVELHDDRINNLEDTDGDLKKVAGDRLQHLDSAVKMEKNTKKLLWAGAAAVGAFVFKEIGPALLLLFS